MDMGILGVIQVYVWVWAYSARNNLYLHDGEDLTRGRTRLSVGVGTTHGVLTEVSEQVADQTLDEVYLPVFQTWLHHQFWTLQYELILIFQLRLFSNQLQDKKTLSFY